MNDQVLRKAAEEESVVKFGLMASLARGVVDSKFTGTETNLVSHLKDCRGLEGAVCLYGHAKLVTVIDLLFRRPSMQAICKSY